MMERIEDTGFGNLKLIQDPEEFCYGIDAVILADFAFSICPNFTQAVDLGSGTGIIPFILSHKNQQATITGLELQRTSVALARKSCRLNGLEDRIVFLQGDVCRQEDYLSLEADLVTCNPPYVIKGGGMRNENTARLLARHEISAQFEDFAKAAAAILKKRGHFFIVHRPSRLVDIFCGCRKHNLEPKDIRFVAPRAGEPPNIVLIHCTVGGGPELKFRETLYVYQQGGSYSDEIEEIYERKPRGTVT